MSDLEKYEQEFNYVIRDVMVDLCAKLSKTHHGFVITKFNSQNKAHLFLSRVVSFIPIFYGGKQKILIGGKKECLKLHTTHTYSANELLLEWTKFLNSNNLDEGVGFADIYELFYEVKEEGEETS